MILASVAAVRYIATLRATMNIFRATILRGSVNVENKIGASGAVVRGKQGQLRSMNAKVASMQAGPMRQRRRQERQPHNDYMR